MPAPPARTPRPRFPSPGRCTSAIAGGWFRSARRLARCAALAVGLALVASLSSASAQEPSGLQALAALEEVLVEAIAAAEKSVVSIARVKLGEDDAAPLFLDPFNRSPLLSRNPADPDYIPEPDFIPNDFGSGVILDRRGLVLTNLHVLGGKNFREYKHFVTTSDRRTYRTQIKGYDPRSDLAVLEIVAGSAPLNLTPIKLGHASTLRKGQIVIALGNPYAIARDGQASASWGIISNLRRKAGPEPDANGRPSLKTSLHHFGTLIQTDARLNFGTSGGALVNLKGEMVGLVTSLAALNGFEQAAGYAIPVDDTMLRAVDQLKQGREVEYGFLGVEPRNLDPHEILAGRQGMRVGRIVPGTPAHRYGLQRDDLVLAVNGEPIHDVDGLMLGVGKLPAEANARLTVERNGQVMQLDVELAKIHVPGEKVVTSPAPTWRGMRVDYATAQPGDALLRMEALLIQGLAAVVEVEMGSPAWNAGLRPEMIISHVGNSQVETPRDFHAAVAGKTGPVELHVMARQEERIERLARTVEPDAK